MQSYIHFSHQGSFQSEIPIVERGILRRRPGDWRCGYRSECYYLSHDNRNIEEHDIQGQLDSQRSQMGDLRLGALHEGQRTRCRLGGNYHYASFKCQVRLPQCHHRQPRTVRHVDHQTKKTTMQRRLHRLSTRPPRTLSLSCRRRRDVPRGWLKKQV